MLLNLARLALLFFLLLIPTTAHATEVTVTGQTLYPGTYNYGGETATIRFYSSVGYVTSDGQPVVAGTTGSAGFYMTVTCTVSSRTLNCPSFTIPSTTDGADRTDARITAVLYDSKGVKRDVLWANYAIKPNPNPVTWLAIALYNKPYIPFTDRTTLSTTQITNLIQSTASGIGDASEVVKGKTKLSVAPAVSNNPIAVGDNDPRVRVPVCAGTDDTAALSAMITAIGTGTLRLPPGTRCKVGILTIPATVTLDGTQGGIEATGSSTVLTIAGPVIAPPDKPIFFNFLTAKGVPTPLTADVDVTSGTQIANQGTVLFSGSASPSIIQAKWWDLTGSPGGAIAPGIRAAGVSLNGKPGEIHYSGGGYVGTGGTNDFLPRSNINIVVVPEYADLVLGPGVYTGSVPAPWIQLSNNSSLICRDNRTTIIEENTAPRNDSNGREWNIVANMYDRGSPSDGLGNGSVGKNMNVINCGFKGARSTAISSRTAITLGNCHHCSYQNLYLDNINSLALHVGAGSGSGADPLGLGLFADDFQVINNTLYQCNSQNIAVVNAKNTTVDNNHVLDPGKAGGGGSTPIDVEPNSVSDQMYNVRITNNIIEAKDPPDMVNTGIAVQNGNGLPNFGPIIVRGNIIISGYLEEYGADPPRGQFGVGIWVNGGSEAKDVTVQANYIRGVSQHGILIEGRRARVKDNVLVRVAGGSFLAVFIDSTAIETDVSGNSIYCNTATTADFAPCDARIRTDANSTDIYNNLMVAHTGGGAQSGVVLQAGTDNREWNNRTRDPDGGWLSGNVPTLLDFDSALGDDYFIDYQLDGVSKFKVATDGTVTGARLPLGGIRDAVITGGLVADAVVSTDGVTTSASNQFTSGSKSCVNAAAPTGDIGKSIIIYQSGAVADAGVSALNSALRTTISSCSGSAFVLATTASHTGSSKRWVYGTNNTTVMQTLASSLTSGGTIYFPPGNYMMGSVTLLSGTTLRADPETATFYSVANSMFLTSNANNVTINGLTIDAGGNPTGNGGVTLLGGTTMNNLRIENCHLTDTFLTSNVAPVSTFNRHGILARNYDGLFISHCKFEHGLRIKAHGGSGNAFNADVHDNYFYDMNENGFSLLDSTSAGIARNINFHHNTMEGVMSTGNVITIGDDGFLVNVSAATNASPTVLTTSGAHNLTNGQSIYIYGGTGSWTGINGTFTVTVLTSTTFSIPVDATGFGALAGTVRLGGVSEQSNISITNNIFRGPLPANTGFIQNRGNYTQKNVKISDNIFDNRNGSALLNNVGLNIANQSPSGGSIVNLEVRNNQFLGDYDYAALRAGNIGSGVIEGNQITPTSASLRCMRLGSISNLTISNNRMNGCGTGLYFNDGAASGLEVKFNTITLSAANSAIGIYIDAQSQAFAATFLRNSITGAGGVFTNVYGIQDAENGGGDTSGVIYVDNAITNITTTTGLGSFKYRTLPTVALVTEQTPSAIPQLLSSTGQNDSATPDVRGMRVVREAYTGAQTVTAINSCSPGVPLTILFTTANVTIQDNASIQLAGGANFVGSADDVLVLMCTSTGTLVESSRSVN